MYQDQVISELIEDPIVIKAVKKKRNKNKVK